MLVDLTKEDFERVPRELRGSYLVQRKVEYAWTIRMPNARVGDELGAHNAVKAEVRVMLMRGPKDDDALEPLLPLVRLSRGKMLGVDQNKSQDTLWDGRHRRNLVALAAHRFGKCARGLHGFS